MSISTPLFFSSTKKRPLTSPEDLGELKKNRRIPESDSDCSNRSVAVNMAESVQSSKDSPDSSSIPSITQKEHDLKTIDSSVRRL